MTLRKCDICGVSLREADYPYHRPQCEQRQAREMERAQQETIHLVKISQIHKDLLAHLESWYQDRMLQLHDSKKVSERIVELFFTERAEARGIDLPLSGREVKGSASHYYPTHRNPGFVADVLTRKIEGFIFVDLSQRDEIALYEYATTQEWFEKAGEWFKVQVQNNGSLGFRQKDGRWHFGDLPIVVGPPVVFYRTQEGSWNMKEGMELDR